jgi:ribonuclease E
VHHEPAHHEPAHQEPAEFAPAETVATPEQPRRGSTVRERAPTARLGGDPSPRPVPTPEPAEPVVSSPTEAEDATRPRRSGWWSRRILGKE